MLTLDGHMLFAGHLMEWPTFRSRQAAGTERVDQFHSISFPEPTVVVQMSLGRQRLLVLADNGRIWGIDKGLQARKVKFKAFEYTLDDPTKDPARIPFKYGAVRKVIAGWCASAAIVQGHGVLVWFDPDEEPSGETVDVVTREIPPISTWQTMDLEEQSPEQEKLLADETIKDVVVGEHFLIILTTAGRVFATDIRNPDAIEAVSPVQLFSFMAPNDQSPFNHLSGSFRKFAVFNEEGTVYLGDDTTVDGAINYFNSIADGTDVSEHHVQPKIINGLQRSGIVDIAFGGTLDVHLKAFTTLQYVLISCIDWHALAMDKRGRIFSWGTESKACGSLGLGKIDEARARGVVFARHFWDSDGQLAEPQEVYIHPNESSKISPCACPHLQNPC